MNTVELRKRLHKQIDYMDEKSLEAMWSILEDYLFVGKDFALSENHKSLIDERLEDFEKNPKNVISWDESKKLLKKYL